MEWVLQLADEFDDLVGMLAHWALGAAAGLGFALAGAASAGICAAAYLVGAEPVSLTAAAVGFGVASVWSWNRRFLRYTAP